MSVCPSQAQSQHTDPEPDLQVIAVPAQPDLSERVVQEPKSILLPADAAVAALVVVAAVAAVAVAESAVRAVTVD